MESTKPTNKQIDTLSKHETYYFFVCPSCGVESSSWRTSIENPGEDETQVYCVYGCGYIYLDYYESKVKIKHGKYGDYRA
jgi:hypothetical protein